MTNVVNIKKTKNYDVYIGRGSLFGNPYTHIPTRTKASYVVDSREEAIKKYEEYFYNRIEYDTDFLIEVLKLEGKTLGCYCSPKPCHGDIIIEFLEEVKRIKKEK